MKKENKVNKKEKNTAMKVFTRILALALVIMMLGSTCFSFISLLING